MSRGFRQLSLPFERRLLVFPGVQAESSRSVAQNAGRRPDRGTVRTLTRGTGASLYAALDLRRRRAQIAARHALAGDRRSRLAQASLRGMSRLPAAWRPFVRI
jgi:hypothetical protein